MTGEKNVFMRYRLAGTRNLLSLVKINNNPRWKVYFSGMMSDENVPDFENQPVTDFLLSCASL